MDIKNAKSILKIVFFKTKMIYRGIHLTNVLNMTALVNSACYFETQPGEFPVKTLNHFSISSCFAVKVRHMHTLVIAYSSINTRYCGDRAGAV